ncbi:PAS domain-containing protein [Flavobacterium sp.]|uniref:sensor histidine kinase n=1 Tax=Flavobacterium sp. TaxID=239 RepID=UPI003D0AECDB
MISKHTDSVYLNKILTNISAVFFQFTIDVNRQLKFDYLSGDVEAYFGVALKEAEQDSKSVFARMIHAEDQSKFIDSVAKLMHDQGKWELEFRVLSESDGVKWYKIDANTEKNELDGVAFFGVISDITVQKKFEEDSRIAELRSQFANQASGIGVWDWNMVTNEVFYSSQSLKILEIENNDHDLIANPEKWDELVHPEDREVYFGNIKEHFEGSIPYYETYHRVLCNGRYKWILDRGKVIARDALGNPLRIIGTHTDVTSQKEKEQKLQETFDVVNCQKGKLLNFAHIVSHNLKSHTGNFCMLLSFHKNGYITTEEVIKSLQIVSTELKDTIDNLVELVNVQVDVVNEKQDLNLKSFLAKVLSLLNEDLVRNLIEVEVDVSEDLEVSFIPAYLESVVLNLASNAIKYSDADKERKFVSFYMEDVEGYDVFCVKDNGLGINLARFKEAVFGLYKTFHGNKDSTGIGLYITKNQIEAMEGRIEVESEVGVGSVFKVYFKKKSIDLV